MKKLIPALCVVFFSFNACSLKAQYVTIPDTAFVNWLNSNGYSACMNGNQMDTTCNAVVTALSVYCSHGTIQDMEGIQYFDNLQVLDCSYNAIMAFPHVPQTLTRLWCSYNPLFTMGALPNSISVLNCENTQLSNFSALPTSLTYLYCYNTALTGLPALPNGLQGLHCYYTQIASLPALPNSLIYLMCQHTPITSLPALPPNLQDLYCGGDNFLTGLPVLPNSIKNFEVFGTQLTSLPILPTSLMDLMCFNNALTSLPALPNGLSYIFCGGNQLTGLPALPSSLRVLDCNSNQITALPVLPNSLGTLDCSQNPLTVLPALPAQMTILNCSSDLLAALPTLPPALYLLRCSHNQISTFSGFTNALHELYCDSNQVTSLPELPDTLTIFDCTYNPGLLCFPQLKRVYDFRFTNTGITCLPNYPDSNVVSNPALNTVPVCNFFNTNGCAVYWNISGKVYADTIPNCIADAGEVHLINMKLELSGNGILQQTAVSGSEGFYSFDTYNYGNYEVRLDTSVLPFSVSCPTNNLYTETITALDSLKYDRDFAVTCKPGFDIGAWSMVNNTNFRPARYTTLYINAGDVAHFYGVHCATGIAGVITATINGPVTYIAPASGATAPTAVSGNTITWNVSDFGTVNGNTNFNVILCTDTSAHAGQQVCFTITAPPLLGDNNPLNNTLTNCYPIVNSFDPNEKEVYPSGNTDAQDHLTYTIHFQNTGNAPAQDIHVDDTLDTDLDPASFQLLAYSHQPVVQIKQNVVRFNFLNINLPDSNTNEPASHGYVQYKVKLKNNLPLGTQINNTAYIYFDFNAPVGTNTTSNTISTNTGITQFQISNPKFQIYPNPASNAVNIVVDEGLIGSTITVTDITGREIMKSAVQIQNSKFEIPNLTNGIYFVTIRKDGAVFSQKLVVQR